MALIRVYWAPTSARLPRGLLATGEQEVAAGFRRAQDGRAYAAAHSLLRLAVAAHFGLDARTVSFGRRCVTCGGSHGKPHVTGRDDVHVSLSHTSELVAVAVTAAGPVGVDVERCDAAIFAGFDDLALAPGEHAEPAQRALIWTRKEAVLKATGHGLSVSPTTVVVSAADAPAALLDGVGIGLGPDGVRLTDLDVGPAHVGCVAVLGGVAVDVEVRDACRLTGWAVDVRGPRTPAGPIRPGRIGPRAR